MVAQNDGYLERWLLLRKWEACLINTLRDTERTSHQGQTFAGGRGGEEGGHRAALASLYTKSSKR